MRPLILVAIIAVFVSFKDVMADDDLGITFYPEGSSLTKLSPEENKEIQEICGKRTKSFSKSFIGHGRPAEKGQFPWTAVLQINFPKVPIRFNYCGATIISKRHLLLAGHCFHGYKEMNTHGVYCVASGYLDDYFIGYGGICTQASESHDCKEEDVMAYRKFKSFMYFKKLLDEKCQKGFDFGIIELENPLEFNDHTQPACVHFDEDMELTNLQTVGFGIDETRHEYDQIRLKYFDLEKPAISNVTDALPDVADYQPKDPGDGKYPRVCPGDSGSGLYGIDEKTKRSYIRGVTSFGFAYFLEGNKCDGTGLENSRVYVTKVSKYGDVICEKTGVCKLENTDALSPSFKIWPIVFAALAFQIHAFV